MIFYDCRHCGDTNCVNLVGSRIGQYARIECGSCEKDNFVKMTRLNGDVLTWEEISVKPGFRKEA